MMALTHLLFGFLAGMLAIQFLEPGNPLLFLVFVLLGSLLPDVDHPRSTLGRSTKVFAWLFEHRGFLHSLFAVVLILVLSRLLMPGSVFMWAVPIGYLSHIISDCLTKEGIMVLHPLSRFKIKGFVRTGSKFECAIIVVLLLVSAWRLLML